MSATARAAVAVAADQPHVLREYALLADGERGAIVGPRGDIVWMCFPRWDSPAVFSSLIGGGGAYAMTPRERYVWGGYYEPGSLMWCGRWVTGHAVIECREALALPSSSERAVLLRRVRALRGTAHMDVVLDPRAAYGHSGMRRLTRREDDVWTAELEGDIRMAWAGAAEATPRADGHGGKALAMELRLEEGEHRDCVLVLASAGADAEPPKADWAWEGVQSEWRSRVPEFEDTAAPRDVRHAYAVLAGMTSAGGGMVAAATTSLPERAREGRSYDYRYVWIRDQCYAGQAVARAGAHPLMDDAVGFVTARLLEDGRRLMPAYTTTAERVPDESHLDLAGYPGGSDVTGNWVNEQFQLDAFGEALLLYAAAARHDHLDADSWRAVEVAVEAIEARWREAKSDAGVWELDPDAWTHSRLMCAAGLRQIAAQAQAGQAPGWVALADKIVSDTAQHGLHPSGRWQRSPTDPRIDAALLMAGVRGAIPADDPRTLATLHSVRAELTDDGYCYRYRPDERPLGSAEGAFLLCGFWLAQAYAQQGDALTSARWFERNRAACGPPGLFSEEYDVKQRQLRGNLPQAFVHAQLIETAVVQSELAGSA
jgi:alpha,alpha-trehalase